MQQLEIHITKQVQDSDVENYKTLIKEIKENIKLDWKAIE
jgi:hypothetical protein